MSVLVAACTWELPTPQTGTGSSVSSAQTDTGSILSDSGAIVLEEGAAPAEEATVQEHRERLLPNGILEIGKTGSGLTLLLFTEHHSPYPRDFAEEQLPRLLSEFVTTDNLKIQIAILTLQKYPGSTESAKALYCAARQGKGLRMHYLLFAKPDTYNANAAELELDVPTFETCMRSDDATAKIAAQQQLAAETETTLIPTFFLDGEKFVGLPYYADLRARIEKTLR